MADPRDNLDPWLEAQAHPMPPPPGTFELIRKRARRRKVTRAAVTAAGAAAVITIIAAVPTLLIPRLQLGPGPAQTSAQTGQTQAASSARGSATSAAPTQAPAARPPVPPHFAAASVTFIGTLTGWVLGQAGVPGHCPIVPRDCTSIARTDDGGATWYGVSAPVTGAPSGPAGVSQIRFLDQEDGWAFGPELFATHDGGQHWTSISTGGLRVTALEARGDRVFAVWAQCTGTGSDFAANCTSFAVHSAMAGSDRWTPVAGATASAGPGGAAGSASLLLTGTRGYLLTPGGDLLSGPVSGQGAWQPLISAPITATPAGVACMPGAAQPNGQPAGEMLAATGPSGLVAVCTGQAAAGAQPKIVYTSTDSGAKWRPASPPPAAGTATSVAGTPSGAIVLATSLGIEVSADGGATWAAAQGSLPAGGFAFVGMTTSTQGVAVPADPSQDAVWFTLDGGQTWQASPVK